MKHFNYRVRSHKLQMMISVSFSLIAVLGILVTGLLSFATYMRTVERQVIEDNIQLANQVELNLTNYLRNMMRVSNSLYYNVIKDVDFSEDNVDREMALLYEVNKDNLVSLACFDKDGNLVAATPVDTLKKRVNVRKQAWFLAALEEPENQHFSSSHVQNLFVDSSNQYRWVISLSKGVEITKGGTTSTGILLVDMNYSGIEHLFTKVNTTEPCYMYLMDQNGEIIYHPKQNLINSELYQENNAVAVHYEDGQHVEKFNGQDRILIVKTVGYTGWKIVSVMPKHVIYRNLNQMNMIAMTVLVVGISLMILINQMLSSKITRPLHNLEKSVRSLELQCPENIYIGGSDEIQHLGKTIRSMVEQMRKLMDDVVREHEDKRRNELDALQSQINPHFLYNTLDSIVWMIESERYEEAISMVTALASLFRIALSRGKTIISVEEEFLHAMYYSQIQKVRFKNKFRVTFLLDDKIRQCRTIKLVIQPLLENSIYYGMESMDGDGEILVSGYEKGQDIYIDVIDNGIGMAPEMVALVLKGGQFERKRGSGIGLANVDQRIKLYFGNEYGLQIKSEPDVGTRITIHLPKQMEEVEHGN